MWQVNRKSSPWLEIALYLDLIDADALESVGSPSMMWVHIKSMYNAISNQGKVFLFTYYIISEAAEAADLDVSTLS